MVEYRHQSQADYDLFRRNRNFFGDEHKSTTGWLSLKRTKEPILTLEVDENSIFLAFDDWGFLAEHGLGRFANAHADVVATVYSYHTGPSPSINPSDGEHHRRYGWHNACFLGVVGRNEAEIRDAISLALTSQVGVPQELVETRVKDRTKLRQVSCRNPSDYIPPPKFPATPAWHIEDGRCWMPAGEALWFTRTR